MWIIKVDEVLCVTIGQPYDVKKSKMASYGKFKSENRR